MIPLANGRLAYGQYLLTHELMGTLVRVLDRISEVESDPDSLATAGTLFPPVFVGLLDPLKSKRWKPIGNLPVKETRFPYFRWRLGLGEERADWRIWDGENDNFVGVLSPEQARLEPRWVWSAEWLEERILDHIEGRNGRLAAVAAEAEPTEFGHEGSATPGSSVEKVPETFAACSARAERRRL